MKKKRGLNELAGIYLDAAALQSELIGQNREKLRLSKTGFDYKETLRLKRLLCLLYKQKRELVETANYLTNYYRLSTGTARGTI